MWEVHSPALIEKSIRKIATIASHIVSMSFWSNVTRIQHLTEKRLTESLSHPVKIEATDRVNPSKSMAKMQINAPNNMYGLLRPNRDVQLSANTPISGCIMRPESGPATNTTAMLDLDNPSDNKYGEAA